MGLMSSFSATSSGLQAQRVRMDVVGANVANINTTSTDEGGPYQRKVVRFAEAGGSAPFANVISRFTGQAHGGVVVVSTASDDVSPMQRVFDPGHADADEDGFVLQPNVDLVTEMTDLTSASRSYSANVTVLNALKDMALRALDIGNR